MNNPIRSRSVLRAAVCGALLLALSTTPVCVLRAADQPRSTSGSSDLNRELMGTWAYVGEPGKVGDAPAKGGFIKLRTATHWAAILIDSRSALVERTHGGTWQVNGNEYQESVEYGVDYQASIMNKTFKWKVTVEGDTMTMVGLDNSWHEVWKRVK